MLFLEHAAEQFAHPVPEHCQRYLLIDAAATEDIDVQAALRWSGPAIDVLTLLPVNWRDTASPVLLGAPAVAFTNAQSLAWKRFTEQWRYGNALTLVESSLTLRALAQALRERMDVALDGGLTMMLRLQDNRVLSSLLEVLRPDQVQQMLGIAQRWVFASRNGEALVASDPMARGSALDAPSHVHVPLTLSQDQETRLLRLSEADTVIGILLANQNDQLMALLPPEQHAQVTQQLQAADELHIEQPPDRISYCATALALGPDFHSQPPWQEVMQGVRRGDKRFGEVLEEMALQP